MKLIFCLVAVGLAVALVESASVPKPWDYEYEEYKRDLNEFEKDFEAKDIAKGESKAQAKVHAKAQAEKVMENIAF